MASDTAGSRKGSLMPRSVRLNSVPTAWGPYIGTPHNRASFQKGRFELTGGPLLCNVSRPHEAVPVAPRQKRGLFLSS